MFCPECRYEYREGLDACNRCRVPLVEELPPLPVWEYAEYEPILATYNAADIAMVKCSLIAGGIRFFFKGENFVTLKPYIHPAILMVKEDQAELARSVLEDIHLAYMVINPPATG